MSRSPAAIAIPNQPRVLACCEPGVNLGLPDFGWDGGVELADPFRDSVNVGLGKRPYPVLERTRLWDHRVDEIFQLSGRTVIRHEPDADLGRAVASGDNGPLRVRVLRRLNTGFSQSLHHVFPAGLRFGIGIGHHPDRSVAVDGVIDSLEQLREPLHVPVFDFIRIECDTALVLFKDMSDSMEVVRSFQKQNAFRFSGGFLVAHLTSKPCSAARCNFSSGYSTAYSPSASFSMR